MSAFHNPTVALCRLYRCTSKTGSTYFRGRLGATRVVLLKDRETAEDGSEIWNLLVQETPAKGDGAAEAKAEPKPQAKARPPAEAAARTVVDDARF